MKVLHQFLLSSIIFFQYVTAIGQVAIDPKPSPLSLIRMKYKDAYVKITYSQPHKRGREIFGKLIPYGTVWRTGANEATEITTTKDILVQDKVLKAGTYSIFTIPEKDKWTVIINSDVGLWGSYNYNQKLDVMRVEAPVERLKNIVYEPFTIQFDQKNELAELVMLWDDSKVVVPIKFIN